VKPVASRKKTAPPALAAANVAATALATLSRSMSPAAWAPRAAAVTTPVAVCTMPPLVDCSRTVAAPALSA